jgi:peptidoglycan-N-acetylmuramic acid deacetylase
MRQRCRPLVMLAGTAVFVLVAALAWAGAPAAVLAAPAPALSPTDATTSVSNTARDWYFMSRGAHERPGIPSAAARLLRRYSGIWIGARDDKVLYLTFDAAHELGTTKRIVGILERAHVKASFFLTGRYMHDNPGITRSIFKHGNLVCNHTYSHPRMTALAGDRSAFTSQVRATERAYHAATGERLAPFFRMPYGTYSARSLDLMRGLGYLTVFWSFAYVDYNDDAQPPVSVARARLIAAASPGVVYLLHAGSTANANALTGVIRELKHRGYRFATLDELR